MTWFVYILRCSDQSLYTGVTTDIERRLKEHNGTKAGARYTRGKRPVEIAYRESADSQSTALKREYEIKNMTREQKEALLQADRLEMR